MGYSPNDKICGVCLNDLTAYSYQNKLMFHLPKSGKNVHVFHEQCVSNLTQCPLCKQQDVNWEKGEGHWRTDVSGNKYLSIEFRN